MKLDYKEVVMYIEKVVVLSIRTVYKSLSHHPLLVGMSFITYLLYTFLPGLFAFLVTSSPVIICTTLLLGTLLSFGEPNFPEIEEDTTKNTVDISPLQIHGSIDDLVMRRDDKLLVESSVEGREEIQQDGGETFLAYKGYSNNAAHQEDEIPHVERSLERKADAEASELEQDEGNDIAEMHNDLDGMKLSNDHGVEENGDSTVTNRNLTVEQQEDGSEKAHLNGWEPDEDDPILDEDADHLLDVEGAIEESEQSKPDNCQYSLLSSKPIGGYGNFSDSYSDEEESSPDASMTDIIPLLDELYPLIDSDNSRPVTANKDESDDDSEVSSEDQQSDNDSDEDVAGDKQNEEVQQKDTKSDVLVTWTADDEKNITDLGISELVRNQRLENLIARRRARKRAEAGNLIDLGIYESASFIDRFPHLRVSPAPRKTENPFDENYDSEGNEGLPPIPGSAPSVFRRRNNPFDFSFDLSHDSFNNSFATNEGPSRDQFMPAQRSNLSSRTFTLRDSYPRDYREKSPDTNLSHDNISEESHHARYQTHFSEASQSKMSPIPESESVPLVSDQNYREEPVQHKLQENDSTSSTMHREVAGGAVELKERELNFGSWFNNSSNVEQVQDDVPSTIPKTEKVKCQELSSPCAHQPQDVKEEQNEMDSFDVQKEIVYMTADGGWDNMVLATESASDESHDFIGSASASYTLTRTESDDIDEIQPSEGVVCSSTPEIQTSYCEIVSDEPLCSPDTPDDISEMSTTPRSHHDGARLLEKDEDHLARAEIMQESSLHADEGLTKKPSSVSSVEENEAHIVDVTKTELNPEDHHFAMEREASKATDRSQESKMDMNLNYQVDQQEKSDTANSHKEDNLISEYLNVGPSQDFTVLVQLCDGASYVEADLSLEEESQTKVDDNGMEDVVHVQLGDGPAVSQEAYVEHDAFVKTHTSKFIESDALNFTERGSDIFRINNGMNLNSSDEKLNDTEHKYEGSFMDYPNEQAAVYDEEATEKTEFKEIDESILSELDAVGDFRVGEYDMAGIQSGRAYDFHQHTDEGSASPVVLSEAQVDHHEMQFPLIDLSSDDTSAGISASNSNLSTEGRSWDNNLTMTVTEPGFVDGIYFESEKLDDGSGTGILESDAELIVEANSVEFSDHSLKGPTEVESFLRLPEAESDMIEAEAQSIEDLIVLKNITEAATEIPTKRLGQLNRFSSLELVSEEQHFSSQLFESLLSQSHSESDNVPSGLHEVKAESVEGRNLVEHNHDDQLNKSYSEPNQVETQGPEDTQIDLKHTADSDENPHEEIDEDNTQVPRMETHSDRENVEVDSLENRVMPSKVLSTDTVEHMPSGAEDETHVMAKTSIKEIEANDLADTHLVQKQHAEVTTDNVSQQLSEETNSTTLESQSGLHVIEARSLEDIPLALRELSMGPIAYPDNVLESENISSERSDTPEMVIESINGTLKPQTNVSPAEASFEADYELHEVEAQSLEDNNLALQQLSKRSDALATVTESVNDPFKSQEDADLAETSVQAEDHSQVDNAMALEDIDFSLQQSSEGTDTYEKETEFNKEPCKPRSSVSLADEASGNLYEVKAQSFEDMHLALQQLSEGTEVPKMVDNESFEFQTNASIAESSYKNDSDLHEVEAQSLEDIDLAFKRFSGSTDIPEKVTESTNIPFELQAHESPADTIVETSDGDDLHEVEVHSLEDKDSAPDQFSAPEKLVESINQPLEHQADDSLADVSVKAEDSLHEVEAQSIEDIELALKQVYESTDATENVTESTHESFTPQVEASFSKTNVNSMHEVEAQSLWDIDLALQQFSEGNTTIPEEVDQSRKPAQPDAEVIPEDIPPPSKQPTVPSIDDHVEVVESIKVSSELEPFSRHEESGLHEVEAKTVDDIHVALNQFSSRTDTAEKLAESIDTSLEPEHSACLVESSVEANSGLLEIEAQSLEDLDLTLKQLSGEDTSSLKETQPSSELKEPYAGSHTDLHNIEARSLEEIHLGLKPLSDENANILEKVIETKSVPCKVGEIEENVEPNVDKHAVDDIESDKMLEQLYGENADSPKKMVGMSSELGSTDSLPKSNEEACSDLHEVEAQSLEDIHFALEQFGEETSNNSICAIDNKDESTIVERSKKPDTSEITHEQTWPAEKDKGKQITPQDDNEV